MCGAVVLPAPKSRLLVSEQVFVCVWCYVRACMRACVCMCMCVSTCAVRAGLDVPMYCTVPIHWMGQMFMYDAYQV